MVISCKVLVTVKDFISYLSNKLGGKVSNSTLTSKLYFDYWKWKNKSESLNLKIALQVDYKLTTKTYIFHFYQKKGHLTLCSCLPQLEQLIVWLFCSYIELRSHG